MDIDTDQAVFVLVLRDDGDRFTVDTYGEGITRSDAAALLLRVAHGLAQNEPSRRN